MYMKFLDNQEADWVVYHLSRLPGFDNDMVSAFS
jgi:hypothetical protein